MNEWIKIRLNLSDDPAVIGIAAATGLDEFGIVGRLVALWSWADKHTVDGDAPSVTQAWLDRHVNAPGFAEEMIAQGWLEQTSTGIRFPKFSEHNGQSAKRRALTANRNAKYRSESDAKKDATVTQRASRNAHLESESESEEESDIIDQSDQGATATKKIPTGLPALQRRANELFGRMEFRGDRTSKDSKEVKYSIKQGGYKLTEFAVDSGRFDVRNDVFIQLIKLNPVVAPLVLPVTPEIKLLNGFLKTHLRLWLFDTSGQAGRFESIEVV